MITCAVICAILMCSTGPSILLFTPLFEVSPLGDSLSFVSFHLWLYRRKVGDVFRSGALQRALRCTLIATVSVECRSTNGRRLGRNQKDVPFQSLVVEWPFTAPPDLYHVNEMS
jgi:hypothetical protein